MKRKTTPPNPADVATLTPSDLLRMSDSDYDAARTAARTGNVAPVILERIEYAAAARLQFAVSRYTHLLRYRNVAERVVRHMDSSFDRWVSMWMIDDVVVYEDITPTPTPAAVDDDAYCRGCGCEIEFPVSYVYDDDWYCNLCFADMVRKSE